MPAPDIAQGLAGDARLPPSLGSPRSRPIYRVFVSSTWLDLQPERRALMDALNRMEEMRFVGMEFFGNRPDDTHDASIDQVDLCALFVGIIGHRYGSGITEAEYRRARLRGIPCFVYFKRDGHRPSALVEAEPDLAGRLEAFKRELLRGHTVKEFTTPEELAANATADLHNWVAARWISIERSGPTDAGSALPPPDGNRTNVLRLLQRVQQDWIEGVLEASLHHRAWIELGLDWREDAVKHPWDRIVVAPNRPIRTLGAEDTISSVFDAAQHTLLVLGEPGAGKTTTVLELTRELIARARTSLHDPIPVVLALSTWRGVQREFLDWIVVELGLRYQVPRRLAQSWLDDARLVLVLDGLDEVPADRRAACVSAINAFEEAFHPPGLVVTCRVAEYDGLAVKLRLRAAICLQPLTPEQIEGYFAAAGAGLDHLRLAMRDDAALRELARSPLMLSVMAMAWRDLPAVALSEHATAGPEQRRRQLFDAYVQAALQRRGKTSTSHSPAQIVGWLTWLACRMKEHGYSLFAVEHLQPAWLDGTWRRFGYFMTTRLLGTVGLALPIWFYRPPPGTKSMVVTVSVLMGLFTGMLDFGLAHHGWGGAKRGSIRFWSVFTGTLLLGATWIAAHGRISDAVAFTLAYFVMCVLAFCAPVDVRALDIKPAGSIQWSWRLSLQRGMSALVLVNLIVCLGWLSGLAQDAIRHGWRPEFAELAVAPYFSGLAAALVLIAFGWWKVRPSRAAKNIVLAITLALIGGQVGATVGVRGGNWEFVLFEMALALLIGVVCGFASTMIDPARPQPSGAWFWLRVPTVAFVVVGVVMVIPGLVLLSTVWSEMGREQQSHATWSVMGFGAVCGLVAFFRFGGFNGVQHLVLRWLLTLGGKLPPKAESFFNHAAQLALLQRVGFGYRFVHALLLDHFVISPPAAPVPVVAPRQVSPVAVALRGVALLGLAGIGLALLWIGAAVVTLWRIDDLRWGAWDPIVCYIGALGFAFGFLLPAMIFGARWFWTRSWWWIGSGYLAVGLAVAGLTRDAAVVRPPATPDQIAPRFPGAEQSFAVLTRYGPSHPLAKRFRWVRPYLYCGPNEPARWRELLTSKRAEIEESWSALSPIRDWVRDLNAFERIGNLRENTLGSPGTAWNLLAVPAELAMARASLEALDGDADAALATLLPFLEVGIKLEASSRDVEQWRVARSLQTRAMLAAGFVLDVGTVSATNRARFAAALAGGKGGAAGARRLYALGSVEVAEVCALPFGSAALATMRGSYYYSARSLEFLRRPLDAGSAVLFKRAATANRWADFFADLEQFAAARETEKTSRRTVGERQLLGRNASASLQNLGGTWLSRRIHSQWDSLRPLRDYWMAEDFRTALHARLTAP